MARPLKGAECFSLIFTQEFRLIILMSQQHQITSSSEGKKITEINNKRVEKHNIENTELILSNVYYSNRKHQTIISAEYNYKEYNFLILTKFFFQFSFMMAAQEYCFIIKRLCNLSFKMQDQQKT